MEIFNVSYEGNKLEAIRTKQGKIYVNLPSRNGKQGNTIFERISRDSEGWKYSCVNLNDFENEFRLWIRDDGRIAAYNNKTNKTVVTKDVFNPKSPNMGQLNHLVTELYKTVEQLKNYEKQDIPAEIIKRLRKVNLLTTLKLLGYSNIEETEAELDESKVYFALERIGKQLSKYINLATYVHVEGTRENEEIIKVNIPDGMNREQFLEMAEPVKDEYTANESYMNEQNEKREQKRSIIPDYCERASKKMPYSDWLLYSRVVKETAKLLLELNADLLGTQDGQGVTDLSRITGVDLEHRIALLINSKDFAKACEIENKLIIREAKRLISELDSMLEEIEETGNMSIKKALEDLREEEKAIINEKNGNANKKTEGVGLDD